MLGPMKSWYLYIAAAVLLVAGIALIAVPHIGDEPSYTCVEEGMPTSGFAIEVDGRDCALSQEDFDAYWDYEHSALPLHRAGLGVAVLGLGTGVAGIVVGHHARRRAKAVA